MTDSDLQNRVAALNPEHSCIVEAPAGSGKTELLTQRFLRLLSAVELPEQLVAVTFTRKAAAEMRQRVIETLRAAANPEATVAPHRQTAVQLARAAIKHSEQCGWPLPAQAQRLRILTVDSLNSALSRQMPISSGGIAAAAISDRAEPLYRLAARRTTEALSESDEVGRGLRQLLDSVDNRLERLEDSLVDCLPQRDRWLRMLGPATGNKLVGHIQSGIEKLVAQRLAALDQLAGVALTQRVVELVDAACAGTSSDEADSAAGWQGAATILLTRQGQWRKRFTRREGFPPDAKALKELLAEVLADLQAINGMEGALAALLSLPDPVLDSEQSAFLMSLGPVLKRLLAELRLVFAELETVDHAEMALAASQSLGSSEMPSDLLLALDKRIEHLLVDEFQDTSHVQWRLLEQLTAGWEEGDGRSLFLVGDPMQSIYRFRDADVSLFLRARQYGIGQVKLRHLRLSSNYRSAPEIVSWVNETFGTILQQADGSSGNSEHYATATAASESDASAGVELRFVTDDDKASETEVLTAMVQAEMHDRPQQSLAILVRSRSHLRGVRAALAEAGIPVHAVEIDSLVDTQLGLDLLSLASALLHPGDRLSWLSLLRGPCCGMSWIDLHALCFNSDGQLVPALITDPERVERLSVTGREQAGFIAKWLREVRELRAERAVGDWLKEAWCLLDGPASLAGSEELDVAERFFADLDGLAEWADIDDPAQLRAWFSRPGQGQTAIESSIEIMTMHRAKGLEFDVVILPSLSRPVRGKDYKLLISDTIDLGDKGSYSLIANASRKGDALAGWLRERDREHDEAERIRLLYVATTRARRRLYLLADLASKPEPRAGSLLSTLWPAVGSEPAGESRQADDSLDSGAPEESATGSLPNELVDPGLRRLLPGTFPAGSLRPHDDGPRRAASLRPEFEWVHPASVQVGTVIHRELQRLADAAVASGQLDIPAAPSVNCRRELALLGVEAQDLDRAVQRVEEAFGKIRADSRAHWILAPRPEAWSELRLTVRSAGRLEHLQLDRSFVDEDGCRWIIDYKTGRHLGADIEGFLDAEVERYRGQLNTYARAIAAIDTRPIQVGLYFPLMSEFRCWMPDC